MSWFFSFDDLGLFILKLNMKVGKGVKTWKKCIAHDKILDFCLNFLSNQYKISLASWNQLQIQETKMCVENTIPVIPIYYIILFLLSSSCTSMCPHAVFFNMWILICGYLETFSAQHASKCCVASKCLCQITTYLNSYHRILAVWCFVWDFSLYGPISWDPLHYLLVSFLGSFLCQNLIEKKRQIV